MSEFAGKGLSFFEVQMRSWFDDHLFDLDKRGLVADRGYEAHEPGLAGRSG